MARMPAFEYLAMTGATKLGLEDISVVDVPMIEEADIALTSKADSIMRKLDQLGS